MAMSGVVSLPRQERRLHRRVSISEVVQLAGGAAARAVDLSLGGIGLDCEHPPQLDTLVRIRARFSDGQEIDTEGEVVRVEGSRVAIRFTALQQRTLLTLLAQIGRR
jgi:hypothetical protein